MDSYHFISRAFGFYEIFVEKVANAASESRARDILQTAPPPFRSRFLETNLLQDFGDPSLVPWSFWPFRRWHVLKVILCEGHKKVDACSNKSIAGQAKAALAALGAANDSSLAISKVNSMP